MLQLKFRVLRNWENSWEYFPVFYSEALSTDLENCRTDTVCPFIGTVDDDGRDIYVGDVLDVKSYGGGAARFIVIWKDFGFMLEKVSSKTEKLYRRISVNRKTDSYKVVGNIHQHPGLINTENWKHL
jgi:hypothetical protein